MFTIEVREKEGVFDVIGEDVLKGIEELGVRGVEHVRYVQLYFFEGDLSEDTVRRIAEELLTDSIVQDYTIADAPEPRISNPELRAPNPALRKSKIFRDQVLGISSKFQKEPRIEIAYNDGVMDSVLESIRKGIADMGVEGVTSIKRARRYIIEGEIEQEDLSRVAQRLLYNKVIEHIVKVQGSGGRVQGSGFRVQGAKPKGKVERIEVNVLDVEDAELERLSKDGQLFLNLKEMRAIKDYFTRLKRNPTDVELESLAQTWSEHCVHKTLRGVIEYREIIDNKPCPTNTEHRTPNTETIDNLLKSTVMRVTEELNKPWCVSVFKDNAGIIKFDKDYNVCFKVETHNHPSALEPYGGAGTGIGGVIRDILGTGLGAKPILNTDIFCFAPPDYPYDKLPKGILHPKRVMKGVVRGVRDYGNKMGVPTQNGAIFFDERYLGNPLVYCGTVGLMPKEFSSKESKTHDLIVVVGGGTGRDGIHGATFSSSELTSDSEEVSSGAVQIGNPITEKKLTDALLKARDKRLYNAITDCGAGGLSSAVSEMGEELGARVDLEKVLLKYQGLTYAEIWISEAQERMVMAVPQEKLAEFMEIFASEDVAAAVIGEFTDDKCLRLFYNGTNVCDLEMEFLHKGLPRLVRKAVWQAPSFEEPEIEEPGNLTESLLKILSSWNVCSKEWVIRQYDHEVQAGSVLKPLQGITNDGPGDACVRRPRLDSTKGIIVSNGLNPKYGLIDPYWMAASAIDEALRQIIAVGGSLEQTALLDNFCWGNTDKPEVLGGLVRASKACYDIAVRYGVPFISGKDSLNNEYSVEGKTISIPPTLLISAISVMDDVEKAVSMDFKRAGSLIYIVGRTYEEMGGSHYYALYGFTGNNVPRVDAEKGRKIMNALSCAASDGLVSSMHDCSEGGIGAALAEMAFSGGLGAKVELGKVLFGNYCYRGERVSSAGTQNSSILFSESNTRWIVEVAKEKQTEFEEVMKGIDAAMIGQVDGSDRMEVKGIDNSIKVSANLKELKDAWQGKLKEL